MINFLLKEEEMVKKLMGKRHESMLFVMVDPDHLTDTTNDAYLKLMLGALKEEVRKVEVKYKLDKDQSPLISIKSIVKEATEEGFTVVFVLQDFEISLKLSESIYRNLEAIMGVDKSRVTYLFLSTSNLLDRDVIGKLHNLKFAISQKVFYYPLLPDEERKYVLKFFSERAKDVFHPKVQQVIYDVCGGHPQMIKIAVYNLADAGLEYESDVRKAEEALMNNKQLHIVCDDIWRFLSKSEREILVSVVRSQEIPSKLMRFSDYLLGTGIVVPLGSGKYGIFGKLFELCVKEKIPQEKLIYDAKAKEVYYGAERHGDKFTLQEFSLLKHFLTNEGIVISRDEVGDVLWGKKASEKYSDWHIDKIISTIRKKLDGIGFPSEKLVTLKGRGFRFSN